MSSAQEAEKINISVTNYHFSTQSVQYLFKLQNLHNDDNLHNYDDNDDGKFQGSVHKTTNLNYCFFLTKPKNRVNEITLAFSSLVW